MAKFEIKKEVFFQRSYILTEATHALTMMALSGHNHCRLSNYSHSIELTVFSYSETEAQEIEENLRELLRCNWQGGITAFTDEEPYFWKTEFTYNF